MITTSPAKNALRLSTLLPLMPDMRRNESFSFIVRAGEFSDNKVEVKVTAGDFELTTRVNNLIIDNHHGSWHSEVTLDANQTYYVVCVGSRNSMIRHLVALPITSLAMLTELTIPENHEDHKKLIKHISNLWRIAVSSDVTRINDSIWSFERLKNEL